METHNDFIIYTSNLLYANFPFQPGKAQPAEGHLRIQEIMHSSNVQDDPVFSFQANGIIHHLEELHHTQSELEYLRSKTLHIYLFEPMCCYLQDDPDKLFDELPFNCGFYSEFNPGTESRHRSQELDSIQKYVKQNNLDNVVVRTGDQGIEVYAQHYPELTLICDDIFLKTLVVFEHALIDKKQLTTKFISTNWRYTPARAVISSLLVDQDCNLVWSYQVDPAIVLGSVWIKDSDTALRQQITRGVEQLNTEPMRYLDMPLKNKVIITENNCGNYPDNTAETLGNPVGINNAHAPLKKFYQNSFLDIVTESRFAQPTANLSEKVFQSIQYKTPFLLVAPPTSLQYLKSMGFKTFDAWWDEGYDTELNHMLRMEKIYTVIQQIAEWDFDKINSVYEEMQEILEYNLNLYITQRTLPGELQARVADNPHESVLVQWQT